MTLRPILPLLGLSAALAVSACGSGSGVGIGGASTTQVVVEPQSANDLADIENETGAHVVGPVPGTTYYVVECPPGRDVDEFLDDLDNDGRVVDADRDEGVQFPEGGLSTLPLFGDDPVAVVATQPSLARIGRATALARTTGAGVRIAVIDTGVVATHPLLAGHVDPDGWDFVSGDADPTDVGNGIDDDHDGLVDEGVGHGTFVASLVIAVAPGARILPIRALDSDARGTASTIAHAIAYAVEHGVAAINISLGLPQNLALVQQAVQSAKQAGVPVFAAVGNRQGAVDFPAALADATAVTAVDGSDRRADFASFGSSVDLSAPGVNVVGAHPRSPSGTARWSGTSFATAIVTGGYALLRAQHPETPSADVARILQDTAVGIDPLNPSYSGRLGRGRIDLAAATAVQ